MGIKFAGFRGGAGSGCGSCGGTTFCVNCTTAPIVGATVKVLSGSTVLGSCTTGSTGCCTISGLSSGTYTITVTDTGGRVLYSASRSITAGGTVTITPTHCTKLCFVMCGGAALTCPGVTVTITLGSTTVFSGPLDASGCVTLATPNGTNTYTFTFTGLPPGYVSTFTASIGGSATLSPSLAAGYAVCCTSVPFKNSYTVTDANGSCTATYDGVSQWFGGYTTSVADAYDSMCNHPATAPIGIQYRIGCVGGTFNVTRTWIAISATGNPGDPTLGYQNATVSCSAIAPVTHPDSSGGSIAMSPCASPTPASVGLTPAGTNLLPDPVGGGVVIS